MKCCSRSTLGVVIGSLNILLYVGVVVFCIVFFAQMESLAHEYARHPEDQYVAYVITIVLLVVSLIMIVISSLLIAGIVQKRHKLMIPWLVLSGIGFIFNSGRWVFQFFGAIFSGASISVILTIFFVGALVTAVSGLILWCIFTLFGDIRQENSHSGGRGRVGLEYRTQNTYKI